MRADCGPAAPLHRPMRSLRFILLAWLAMPIAQAQVAGGAEASANLPANAPSSASASAPLNAPASASAELTGFPGPALRGTALVGEEGNYSVRAGDNLTIIAARLGMPLAKLRADNPDVHHDRLKPGQVFRYTNRHIVPPAPQATGDSILINVPQRMLFLYRDGALVGAWPAAAGRADKAWRTPLGDTTIRTREKDKTWIVPPSIQAEMREKGEPVLTRVPPGPANPLGRYWLGLATGGIGIHGTNAPASVYGARTHGCIRLQPEHIEKLFSEVRPGTPVRILYAPVLLYVPSDGPIWLEAHPDVYARGLDYPALARALLDEARVTERVDPAAAESVLSRREGLATDVTAPR